MAAVAVVFDGTRLTAADATTGFTADSATPTQETDYFYQGTASVSAQVKTAETGFYYNPGGANLSSPQRVWLLKAIITNPAALDGNGLLSRIGHLLPTPAYHVYNIYSASTYPIQGGWQIIPIDPNVSVHRTSTVGSPNLASVTWMGLRADCSVTAKAPNLAMDAVDVITNGTGLTLTGGDGGSTDGTFNDFVTSDEGTSGNRWGVVSTREGVLYVNGVLTIGTATATEFTDSNRVLVFPSSRVDTGFCGVDFGLQSASTIITVSNSVFRGRGTQGTPDTRPDYTVTGTSGTLSITGSTFNTFRNIDLTSKATFTSCSFLSGLKLTQSSGVLTSCVISGATTGDGVAFITSDDPSKISGCSFIFSDGHAIEITTTGTYTFSGNQFSGYGSAGTNDAAIYNNSGGAVTLNITGGGSTPTVRNGSGASTTVNANVQVTLTGLKNPSEVRVFSAGTTTEISGTGGENITSGTHVFSISSGQSVDIVILALGFQNMRILSYSTTADATIPISQVIDRQYANT
jgi:hypothetical protein